MYFKYVGYNKDKEISDGVIEAPSSREAIQKLEEEGISIVVSLKRSRRLLYRKKLSSIKDKIIESPIGKLFKRSTVKIEIKDSEVLQLLKRANLKSEDIADKINDIFTQPKEEVEFKDKKKERPRSRAKDREIVWEQIRKNPEDVAKLRIPFKEVIYFTRQLGVLLSSGVALPTSLLSLSEHTNNKKMKKVIAEINQKVQGGNSLSSAMANFPNQFNELYVSLVYVGESSGTLSECLLDLADFQELQYKIKKKVRNAMIYPIVILIVVAILLVLGSHFLMPMFVGLFEETEMELPRLTKVVFWLAGYIEYVIIGIAAFIIFMFVIAPYMESFYKFIRQYTDMLILKIPVIKNTALTLSMFYFTNPLALMQKNGIRLIDSLKMSYNVVPNHVIKEEIKDATHLLMEGVSISEALSEQPHFDSVVCSMIKTGEDSGSIEKTLEHLSGYYAERLEADTEALMQMIQPIIILIIAAIVVPIIFAIFIPVLDLSSGSFIN